jgi:predicted amidohydrolase
MEEGGSRKPVALAIFQGCAEDGNVRANLQKMKTKMVEAKKMGAEILVFPELFTTGYCVSQNCIRELAEKKDGTTFLKLSERARETGVAILYGYPELVESGAGGQKVYYNSVQFIDGNGRSLANYRKTHLWIEEDAVEGAFKAGEGFSPVFEYRGLKIGLLICYDVEFSEAVRTLALEGAEVVLVPTACCDKYIRIMCEVLIPARAVENRIHVAYVNHCGGMFVGLSRCCGPLGNALISAGFKEEGISMAQIDVDSAAGDRGSNNNYNYLNRRRPDLYKAI